MSRYDSDETKVPQDGSTTMTSSQAKTGVTITIDGIRYLIKKVYTDDDGCIKSIQCKPYEKKLLTKVAKVESPEFKKAVVE